MRTDCCLERSTYKANKFHREPCSAHLFWFSLQQGLGAKFFYARNMVLTSSSEGFIYKRQFSGSRLFESDFSLNAPTNDCGRWNVCREVKRMDSFCTRGAFQTSLNFKSLPIGWKSENFLTLNVLGNSFGFEKSVASLPCSGENLKLPCFKKNLVPLSYRFSNYTKIYAPKLWEEYVPT